MTMTQKRPAEAVDSFASLSAAALHPAWHQAILRLASATDRVASRLEFWGASNMSDGSFVRAARDLAKELIDFLDEVGGDPDADLDIEEVPYDEDTIDLVRCGLMHNHTDEDPTEDDIPAEDDGAAEPSLGAIESHPSCYMDNGRNSTGDQTEWGTSGRDDREDEHDGSEVNFWPDDAA